VYSSLTQNDTNELSPCCCGSLCELDSNRVHGGILPYSVHSCVVGIWVGFRRFVILKNASISFHSSWYKCAHFLRFKPRSGISGTQFLCLVRLIGRLPNPFQSVCINLHSLQQFVRNPGDPHYHQ